jgi:hypothetical protein
MADDLRAALGKYGTTLNRVVLFLDSAGGQVEEGDRVIEALNEIKLHQLITRCPTASCVRPCAYRSSFKARTVLRRGRASGSFTRPPNGRQTESGEPTWRRRGGCVSWLKSIAPMIKGADLWQTGGDLISAKSGIIMHPLGNRTERTVAPSPVDADRGRDLL